MKNVAKVPVVLQMEALECGAASLCMILAYFGKWLPLEQVRADCAVSRDGSSARNIVRAARSYGLTAAGYRMEPENLREVAFPVILHWNFNHFVVFCGFKKDRAVLNDPARGTIEVTREELERAFTGVALVFETGKAFQPEGKPKSVLAFARKRLKGASLPFVFVVLTGILAAPVGVALLLASRVFMDNILSRSNPEWLLPFIGALIIAALFQFLVGVVEAIGWLRMEGRFAITANTEYLWHVLRLPMEFFSQRFAGDIVSRQSLNQSIAATLMRRLAPILLNICLLVFYLLVMIRYSALLSLIGVATVILNIFVARIIARRQIDLSRNLQASSGRVAGVTMTGIAMIETVKASGAEVGFFQKWAGYFAQQHNAQVSMARFVQYSSALPVFLQQAASIAILVAGVYLILDQTFTIGMLLAFQGLVSSFLLPVNQLVEAGQSLLTMRAEMERVDDVLNYRTDRGVSVAAPEAAGEGKLTGALELKNITFGYNRLAPPLISDFSMRVEPGRVVALVGSSGSGKSTVAKLITGLYPLWSGEITFGGRNREEINQHAFKSSVTMVDQDITLFEDTIANNIRMWDRSIEDFAVILAARDAEIHSTIIARPDGFDHIIQEDGKNFSGGQKQRLEIARALAQEPTLIVLDEATSALDAKTEEQVMRNIRDLGATCVVIAHRLSTVRSCDEILVLEKGRLIEKGTHDELLALGGAYAKLISVDG